MTQTPTTGPRCGACGCTAVEHEARVSEDWRWVPGRCLTCPCDGFQDAKGQTVAGFVYDADADLGG